MVELNADFGGDEESNPFQGQQPVAPIGPDSDHSDDDDLNEANRPPKRIKELDDSGDEIEENEKQLEQQYKQNFNQLFANKDETVDCTVQEENSSKSFNKHL